MLRFDASSLCEFLAHWTGGTTLSEIARLLGYTPRRVQTLVNNGFVRRGSTPAHYDAPTRRWISDTSSEQLQGARTVQEAVGILHALHVWTRDTEAEDLFRVLSTRTYQRGPAPDTFRTLLGACVRRQVVDVVYLARTRQLAVSFSPHTLVEAPYRYHFRGYSTFEFEGENHYWDLVPSRVISAEVRPTLGYVDSANDAEWHITDTLRLKLKIDLPETTRRAIQHEHGLTQNILEIPNVRKALMYYVSSEYLDRRYEGFDGSVWEITPNDLPA